MLNELVKRLTARGGERREAERFRKRYPMAWLRGNTLVPGMGVEISVKGILFATKESPAGDHVDVAMDLNGRRVRARLSIARKGVMPREGVDWTVVAGVFEGIAADDWDAIARFCYGKSELGNKAAQELSALANTPDDAYRLLPLVVQQRIVATLVAAGRLAPESTAKNPLLRMQYLRKTPRGQHRLSVHSRRSVDGEMRSYDSVVAIDDGGSVHLER
jgi:hypothetical protein